MMVRFSGPTNYLRISRAPGTGRSRLARAWKLPWKSGALAPRQGANKVRGFSPSVPRGLKALDPREAYAALKGPLFHELARAGKIVANELMVAVILAFVAHAQVTFERLVNSAKEPQN